MTRKPLPAFGSLGPVDDDLTGVVLELPPRLRHGTRIRRDPNEPDVRWLLEAGLRAMGRRFVDEDGGAGPTANRILGAVSLDSVMDALRDLGAEHGVPVGAANRDRVNNRWESVLDYQRDLLRYIFRPAVEDVRMRELEASMSPLFALPLGEVLDRVVRAQTDDVVEARIVRLRTALLTAFPNEPQIQALAGEVNRRQVRSWSRIWRGAAELYGLDFPPGSDVTHDDVALMLAVTLQAGHLRRVIDPRLGTLSSGEHAVVRVVQMLMARTLGLPWAQIAGRRADPARLARLGAADPPPRPEPTPPGPGPASTGSPAPTRRRSDTLPPFPAVAAGDEDLTGVVRELRPVMGRGGFGPRDPNEPDVRWLLESGVVALGRMLLDHRDNLDTFAYDKANAILGGVTLAEVMAAFAELARERGVDPGAANKARLRKYWISALLYQRDLLRYLFRPAFYATRMAEVGDQLPALLSMTFGELVGHLSVTETDDAQGVLISRLQLGLLAAFPREPQIQQLAAAQYDAQCAAWAQVYRVISAAYRVTIGDGSAETFDDMALLFSLVVEGAHLRRVVDPAEGLLTRGDHVATRIIQLLLADLSGRPWEELAQLRADQHSLTSTDRPALADQH